jgi:hypothetical protein
MRRLSWRASGPYGMRLGLALGKLRALLDASGDKQARPWGRRLACAPDGYRDVPPHQCKAYGSGARSAMPFNEEILMPTVMAYHEVKDTDHWLASPKREEFFGPLGVTNIRTFVDPENPTRVGLVMDVADMDAVMAAMETQPAADAMAHDGVLPETLVILVEA